MMRRKTQIIRYAALFVSLATLFAGNSEYAFAHRPATVVAKPDARSSPWPPLQTAGPFLIAHILDETAGRWGTVWTNLYPMHQRIVGKGTYVRCETATPFVLPLALLTVRHVQRTEVVVPGSCARSPASR